ncbi:hypothetical protein Tco_0590427 [Tanacetum coccineum]
MAPLPPRDKRHPWLRLVNRVHVLDFAGLTKGMRQTLVGRLRMVYIGDEGQELMSDTEMGLDVVDTLCFHLGRARRRITLRKFITVLGLHTAEEMAKDGLAPSYVYIKDPVRRLCHKMISCSISGRGRAPEKVTGMLRGGRVELGCLEDTSLGILLLILALLNIYERFGDTWAWVSPRLERQPDVVAGAPKAAKDAPAVDEGALANPAPMQAHRLLHAAPILCLRELQGSRRRYTSYDGALWDCMEMLTNQSLIRVGSLPGWSVA